MHMHVRTHVYHAHACTCTCIHVHTPSCMYNALFHSRLLLMQVKLPPRLGGGYLIHTHTNTYMAQHPTYIHS